MATEKVVLWDKSQKTKTNSTALVDGDVYKRIKDYRYFKDNKGKPVRRTSKAEGGKVIALARDVFQLKENEGKMVFYEDTGKYRDCRRTNLRVEKRKVGAKPVQLKNGLKWPTTAKSFLNFVDSYIKKTEIADFRRQFKAEPEDLLVLIEMADISWSRKRIVMKYPDNSPELEKAREYSLVHRFLKEIFGWEGDFAIAIDYMAEPFKLETEQEPAKVEAPEAPKVEAQPLVAPVLEAEIEAQPAPVAPAVESVAKIQVQEESRPIQTRIVQKDSNEEIAETLPLEVLISQLKKRGATEVRF